MLATLLASTSLLAPNDAAPRIQLVRAVPAPAGRADVATNLALVDHGALVVGWTSEAGKESDGLILRVDEQGEAVWRRELGGAGEDLLWRIVPDGDGFVCVGTTASSGAGGLDGWMLRIDAQGKPLWERTFGTRGDEWLTSCDATPNGWIAVGQTDGRGAGGLDAFVVRVDREGRELASWTAGTPKYERAFSIRALDDGGCVIAGMAGESKETCDAFVERFDADGKPLWTRTLVRPGFGVAHDVQTRPDGTFVVYGYCFVDEQHACDPFVAHLTATGEIASEHEFGGTDNERALHAVTFADGSAVLVGHAQPHGAPDDEASWNMAIYAVDRDGRSLWSGRFGGRAGELGRGIAGTADDLWLVGHTSREHGRESNVLLVRLDVTPLLRG